MDNLNSYDNKQMLKKVGVVAGPIAIQSLIASSLNLVDNLMVGGLGELALNAVGVSVQIYFVYWMLIFGFCSGGATFMSQFFGTKDYTNIRRTAGFAFSVTFCIGIIFFLAATFFPEYLQADTKAGNGSGTSFRDYRQMCIKRPQTSEKYPCDKTILNI